MAAATKSDGQAALLCRVGAINVLLPAGDVVEVLRPPPLEVIRGAPDFIAGLCIVRGTPLPAVDLGRLLDGSRREAGRLVVVRAGERLVGVLVGAVVGLRPAPAASLAALPPLLGNAADGAVALLGALDSELLLILAASHIVPDSVFDAATAAGLAS